MEKMYKIDFEVKPNDEYYIKARDLDEAKEIAKRKINETPFDSLTPETRSPLSLIT